MKRLLDVANPRRAEDAQKIAVPAETFLAGTGRRELTEQEIGIREVDETSEPVRGTAARSAVNRSDGKLGKRT